MVRGALPLLIALFALLTLPCLAISPADRAAFASFAGVYSGGVTGESSESSGWIRIAVTHLGRGTAALKLNGAPLITAIAYETREADGSVSLRLIPKRGVNLTTELAMTKVDGISSITGTVNANGRTAPIAVSKVVSRATPQGWTFRIVNPGGTAIGVGAVRIEKSARVIGRVHLAGKLAATFTTVLKENGKVPMDLVGWSAGYNTRLFGDVRFPVGTATAEDIGTNQPIEVTIQGSRYSPLAPALGAKSGSITLQGADTSAYMVYQAPAKFLQVGLWGAEFPADWTPKFVFNRGLGTISETTEPADALTGIVDQPAGSVSIATTASNSVMLGALPRSTGGGSTSSAVSQVGNTAGGVGVAAVFSSTATTPTGNTSGGSLVTTVGGSSQSQATPTAAGGTVSINPIQTVPSSGYWIDSTIATPALVVVPTINFSAGSLATGGTSTAPATSAGGNSSSTSVGGAGYDSSISLAGSSSLLTPVTLASNQTWTSSGVTITVVSNSSFVSGSTFTFTPPTSVPTTAPISLQPAVRFVDASARPGGQVGDVFSVGTETFRILEVLTEGYRVEVVP